MAHQEPVQAYRQPRKGWQRPKVARDIQPHARETVRVDAPSPGQEVLAKFDAELQNQSEVDDQSANHQRANTDEASSNHVADEPRAGKPRVDQDDLQSSTSSGRTICF